MMMMMMMMMMIRDDIKLFIIFQIESKPFFRATTDAI
jgi:hypothetical protein